MLVPVDGNRSVFYSVLTLTFAQTLSLHLFSGELQILNFFLVFELIDSSVNIVEHQLTVSA